MVSKTGSNASVGGAPRRPVGAAYTAAMKRIAPGAAFLLALASAGGIALGGCSGTGKETAPATPPPPAAVQSPPLVQPQQPAQPSQPPSTGAGATPGVVPATAVEARADAPAPPPPPRAAVPADPTVEMHGEIQRLIGAAACRDDSQCRVLPLGSKPCGGPEGHLAWSTVGTDAHQLEALAARYTQARQARNQRLGLMSDCAIVPAPGVRCVPAQGGPSGGRCQTVPGRGGPSPLTR